MLPAFLQRFRRITSSGRYIGEIDGLRFLAICSVVIYHINGYVYEKTLSSPIPSASENLIAAIFSNGHYGVQLFLVLSGFIISLPFAEHYLSAGRTVDLGHYFLRRLARIEPTYAIHLTVAFILKSLMLGLPLATLFPHFVASLFYLHNLAFQDGSLLNSVAWSLEIEIQYYLLAPFLARFFALRNPNTRRLALLLVGSAAIGGQIWLLPAFAPLLSLTLANFLQFFIAGMLLADLYVTRSSSPASSVWDAIGTLAIVGIGVALQTPIIEKWFGPIFLGTLVWASLRGNVLRSMLRHPVICTIGGMCYTIYLFHPFIISFVGRLTAAFVSPNMPLLLVLQWLIMPPTVLILSSLAFLAFERPFMGTFRFHKRQPSRS